MTAQEADYRRAISYLLSQGYKLSKLRKVVTLMLKEEEEE